MKAITQRSPRLCPKDRNRFRPRLETLESRLTPSTIIWENEGDDNFGDLVDASTGMPIGANAGAARDVVNAAINFWETVITNFNYQNVGMPFWAPEPNKYFLEIEVDDMGDDAPRASTDPPSCDPLGTPYATDITLDINAGDDKDGNPGPGWYIDPFPFDSAEFTDIKSMYHALGSVAGNDLFRTAVHEIGHAMGITESAGIDAWLEDLDVDDPKPDADGELLKYTGIYDLVFTNTGGLHLYEEDFQGLHGDANDLMTSGRASFDNARKLISALDTAVLTEVYGYSVLIPSEVEQFSYAAQFNQQTGVLAINGGLDEITHDAIVIKRAADSILVSVAGQNLSYPFNSVTQINVQTGLVKDGNDVVTLDLSGGNPIPAGGLSVNGGVAGYDRFVISGSDSVVLNGSQVSTPAFTVNFNLGDIEEVVIDPNDVGPATIRVDDSPAGVPNLSVFGAFGIQDDVIDIEHIAANTSLVVDGYKGDDTIYLSFINADLDNLDGLPTMLLYGGDDFDQLILKDQGNSNDNDYALFPGGLIEGGFSRNSSLFIGYDGFEIFDLTAGSGDNDVTVQGTVPGTETHVSTGLGDDTILVDSNGAPDGGTVNGVQSVLVVDGGTGSFVGKDQLILNDESDNAPNTVTITPDSVFGSSFFGPGGTVYYSGLSDLTIYMGGGSDHINVEGTANGTTTNVDGNRGNDHFDVSAPVFDESDPRGDRRRRGGLANAVASPLILDGQIGTDVLVVDDSAEVIDTTVTVSSTTVGAVAGDNFFGPGGSLSYFSMSTLSVLTGAGNDTINVPATNSETTTNLLAGDGRDTVNVGYNNTLDYIAGPLNVHGQAHPVGDRDALNVQDKNTITGQTYVITDDSVQRSGIAEITYHTMETLALNAGEFQDSVFVTATNSGTETTVKTGGGTNSVTVGNVFSQLDEIDGLLVVHGGTGVEVMQLLDQGSAAAQTYTIKPNKAGGTIERSGAAAIRYADLEGVVVNAGLFDDVFAIEASQPWKSTPVVLNAGLGLDTLKGPHIASSWQILAADAGKLNDVFNFFGMENLAGGKDTDKFLFKAGTTVSGAIGGGLGTDVLDYSAYATGVTVDLPGGSATGVGSLKVGTIENVVGTEFDDLILGDFNPNELNGNKGNDVLVGNAGKDKLFGGAGRDLVFGGLGSDELNGGLEDDLLIHGATQWDADTAALNALRDEWTRLDADYAHRITHLRSGGGNNGIYVLVANTTVFDDGVADGLTGDDGQDWFWATYPGIDVIVDLKADEVVN